MMMMKQTEKNNIDCYEEALGSKRIGGVLYAEFVTERSLNAMKNYEIRHDDVWVCAHPKAGASIIIIAWGNLSSIFPCNL